MIDFKGEVAALCAAFLWAVSSVIYARLGQRIPPLALNLLKGAIAIILLILTLLLRGEFLQVMPLWGIAPVPLCLLLLSGVLGIGLGDTAFFVALNCLGARRALLMETLAPPMTAILALIFLQESLSFSAWCGILLTIVGVAWVITEQVPNLSERPVHLLRGIGFGILAAIALATGGVLSRAALATTSISPLWAALLRLSAAVLMLLPWVWLRGKRQEAKKQQSYSQIKIFQPLPVIGAIFFAAFAGTYLGIWLQQTALKFTAAGIALTLTNTSPLFVLLLAIWMGEQVSLRAILGVLIAIGGIAVLFYLR
jgi:drug/metabolite transporter (DMT)-like permease